MGRTICIRFIDYRSLTGLLDAVALRVGSFVRLLWPLGRLALLGFHVRSPPCWLIIVLLSGSDYLYLLVSLNNISLLFGKIVALLPSIAP